MKFYFMSGMPRSGSTLLTSLLNQRNDLFCSQASGTPDIFNYLNEMITNSDYGISGSYTKQKESICKNLLDVAYAPMGVEHIVDKSRYWTLPKNYNLLKGALSYDPKFLIPVRPLEEIVASFLNLFENSPNNYIDNEMFSSDFIQWAYYSNISDARVDTLLSPYGSLRLSMSSLYFAMSNENQENFYYIKYNDLVEHPEKTMLNIENFLKIDNFKYDFNNISSESNNDLQATGIKNLHEIKTSIIKSKNNKKLSDYAKKRCELEDFWTKNIF